MRKRFSALPSLYFNTAAVGQTSLKALAMMSAFEQLKVAMGPASEAAQRLLEGTLPSERARGEPTELGAYWSGLPQLAQALCEVVRVQPAGVAVMLTSGTARALELTLQAIPNASSKALLTTDLEHETEYHVLRQAWRGTWNLSGLSRLVLDGCTQESIVEQFLDDARESHVVLVSHVTAAHGIVLPVRALASALRARNPDILIIIDGAHGPGNIDVDLESIDADVYIGSGHKWLCGPETSGYIVLKPRGVESLGRALHERMITGYRWWQLPIGGDLNRGLYPSGTCALGTTNVIPLVGLMVALKDLLLVGTKETSGRARRAREDFERSVTQLQDWSVVGAPTTLERSAICTIGFRRRIRRNVQPVGIARILETEHGVVCGATSAGDLRFSFDGGETTEELEEAVRALEAAGKKLGFARTRTPRASSSAYAAVKEVD